MTVGLAATGKFPWSLVPAYLAAQVAGAALGAVAILGVLGSRASDLGLGVAAYGAGVGAGQAFIAEFVGTFSLVFVVFGVIPRKAAPGFAGVAIGLLAAGVAAALAYVVISRTAAERAAAQPASAPTATSVPTS